MKLQTAVTFEFTDGKPETIRKEHEASNAATIAARAIRAARQMFRGRKPCSIVVVLESPQK